MAEEKVEKQAAEELPYFEDLLVETRTHRADWLAGSAEIEKVFNGQIADAGYSEKLGAPIRRVRSWQPTRWPWVLVARKTELEAWLKQYTAQKESNRVKQAPNGTAALTGTREGEVIILREGAPLLSKPDAESLKMALWGQKASADALAKAMGGLASSIDANTQQQRRTIEAMDKLRTSLDTPPTYTKPDGGMQ